MEREMLRKATMVGTFLGIWIREFSYYSQNFAPLFSNRIVDFYVNS